MGFFSLYIQPEIAVFLKMFRRKGSESCEDGRVVYLSPFLANHRHETFIYSKHHIKQINIIIKVFSSHLWFLNAPSPTLGVYWQVTREYASPYSKIEYCFLISLCCSTSASERISGRSRKYWSFGHLYNLLIAITSPWLNMRLWPNTNSGSFFDMIVGIDRSIAKASFG